MPKVTSSAISEYDYDPLRRELTVKWNTGGTYVYTKVAPEKVDALVAAKSVGQYVNKNIVPYHEGLKV